MTNNDNIEINENKEICTKCGGRCCNSYPGTYTPENLFKGIDHIDISVIERIIKEKKLSIDKWYGDEDSEHKDVYFLRPRTLALPDSMVDCHFIGKCIHLKENGCELSFEDRPEQCKALIPKIGGCVDEAVEKSGMHTKLYYALFWKPYQSELEELFNRYDDFEFESALDLVERLFSDILK